MLDQVFNALGLTSHSESKANQQSTSTPVNIQNPAYQGLAPGVANALPSFYTGGPTINSAIQGATGDPNSAFNGAPGTGNPLVASLSPQETGFVNAIGNLGNPTAQQLQGNAATSQYLQPGFIDPTKNPITQALVNSSIAPIISAYQQTTVPGIQGQFTAAGQKVGQNPTTAQPGGSSAFDQAMAIAQKNLEQSVGQTAAGINQAQYNTNVQAQQNAVSLANQTSTAMLTNTVNALQASALPRLIQQYGINEGLQVFQSRIQTMLASMGLAGQISQPVVGNQQQSTGSSSGTNQQGILSAVGGGGGAMAFGGGGGGAALAV